MIYIYNDIKISMKRLNFYLIMIWLCSFVIFFCFSENKISGKAFSMLTEANIDDLVPELGSRITLKSVLNEVIQRFQFY